MAGRTSPGGGWLLSGIEGPKGLRGGLQVHSRGFLGAVPHEAVPRLEPGVGCPRVISLQVRVNGSRGLLGAASTILSFAGVNGTGEASSFSPAMVGVAA